MEFSNFEIFGIIAKLEVRGIFQIGNFWNFTKSNFLQFSELTIFGIFQTEFFFFSFPNSNFSEFFKFEIFRISRNWKFLEFQKLEIFRIFRIANFGVFQIGIFRNDPKCKFLELSKLENYENSRFFSILKNQNSARKIGNFVIFIFYHTDSRKFGRYTLRTSVNFQIRNVSHSKILLIKIWNFLRNFEILGVLLYFIIPNIDTCPNYSWRKETLQRVSQSTQSILFTS